MELVPTLQTSVGMLWSGNKPVSRRVETTGVPDGWTLLEPTENDTLASALEEVLKQRNTDLHGRFLVPRSWGAFPELLVRIFSNRTLPILTFPIVSAIPLSKLRANMIAIEKHIDIDTVKSVTLNQLRLDIEQAVGFVLRLLPEYVQELIPLVPTIMTQSCMWLDIPLPVTRDVDKYRRDHLGCLFSMAKIQATGQTWEDLASVLFRVRRKRPHDASRGLRLPEWIQVYYTGDRKELSWDEMQFPRNTIENPIVVSRKNYARITRCIWRIHPNAPEKVLRRNIASLSRRLIYADDAREAISATHDRVSLAYTFLVIQRRLQLKVVSDLNGTFLGKGEAGRFQQNTPAIPTSLEERLAEIALEGAQVDWAVLTSVQRPAGAEAVDSIDELLELVDRICECLEKYVMIYGKGHTEPLRPQPGRRGGFRGPVDDWNTMADILTELRRRITNAGYQVVSEEETMEVDGFTVISESMEKGTERDTELPRAGKFLALDIMSWNNSWKDDVFALEKMPPQWWNWLQKRRSEGKCPWPPASITID